MQCSEKEVERTLTDLNRTSVFYMENGIRETNGRRSVYEFARCFISRTVAGLYSCNETLISANQHLRAQR